MHEIIESPAYYGNAVVFCQTCQNEVKAGHLAVEFYGYDLDRLDSSIVQGLIAIADKHKRETGHSARVIEFRRGK